MHRNGRVALWGRSAFAYSVHDSIRHLRARPPSYRLPVVRGLGRKTAPRSANAIRGRLATCVADVEPGFEPDRHYSVP